MSSEQVQIDTGSSYQSNTGAHNQKSKVSSSLLDQQEPLLQQNSSMSKKSNFKYQNARNSSEQSPDEKYNQGKGTEADAKNHNPSGKPPSYGVNEVQIDESVFQNRNSKENESLAKIRQARLTQKKQKESLEKIFFYIEQKDDLGLTRYFQTQLNVPLIDLVDDRGYTILHQACFKNEQAICETILQKAKETINESQISAWINAKTTEDGFTALHFCSFRGNINLAKLLLDLGASIYARNNYGINVMHVAAQGDQPISLYFFKEMGIDLKSRDSRGSTPIHWACYSKSEIALCYLLSWTKSLEE